MCMDVSKIGQNAGTFLLTKHMMGRKQFARTKSEGDRDVQARDLLQVELHTGDGMLT